MLNDLKEKKLCKKLFDNLDQSTTIVTINRRLANFLRNQYDLYQLSCEQQTWQTADVLPWETWLERCWNNILDEKILLNEFQELLLWEKVIQNSDLSTELLNIKKTAQTVQQAWQLLQQWQINIDLLKKEANYDVQALVKWIDEFNAICCKENFISHASLPKLLTENLINNIQHFPKKIVLAGFNQLPPQTAQLLIALEKTGITTEQLPQDSPAENQYLVSFPNQQQELYSMARWAKQCLTKNEHCNIACVIPDLQHSRDQVERIFMEIFTPFPFLPTSHEHLPFNISVGKNLNTYPLIKDALQILKFISWETINIAVVSRWLRSAFIAGSEQEMSARALLDRELHEASETETSLRTIMSLAQKSSAAFYCPILAKHLQTFLERVKKIPATQLPSEWSVSFSSLLDALGWPGQRTLTSDEYQVLQRWHLLLSEFSGLDFLLGRISHDVAENILQQLAYSIIFQPQTSAAPIQILGMLEVNGMHFDYLWVTGMNDEAWPPLNQPNPFIPIRIQQQKHMPHASMQIEYEFFQTLTECFKTCATEIIFSYAMQIEDRILNPSSLLKNLSPIADELLSFSDHKNLDQLLFATRDLEFLEDWQAPVINGNTKIRGGSNLFKAQAACPFKAFAKYRLAAENLKIPTMGLDAAERGKLLHRTLEYVWNEINDHSQLMNYSQIELENIISDVIDQTLLELTAKKPLTLKMTFSQIEKLRLQKILLAWLNYEKKRSPFIVLTREQSEQITIGNITLTVRTDRIDQLVDGRHIIIDYKTSETSIETWFGERLDEPQLPLYCITSNKLISGIAFAQVYPRDMRFKGIAMNAEQLPNLTALVKLPTEYREWKDLNAQWQIDLTNTITEFCTGNAKVNPKDLIKTCIHCEFKPLCRIYEKTKMLHHG